MPKKTFENALKDLERITGQLEDGELSLEESLKKFEDGIKLVDLCSQKLTDAQKKVEILLKKDGGLTAVPFDEGADSDL